MKKTIILPVLLLGISFVACSDNYSRDADKLPADAKALISENFNSAISLVKEDKEFLNKKFEVILVDGCEVTFNSKGEWTEIETPNTKSVPSNLVPKLISNYVDKQHQGAMIVGIEKEKNGYEVELSNGVEIYFNGQGQFVKYKD